MQVIMLVFSPACLHAFIIGLLDLLWTCHGGVELLTQILGHVKGQGVTMLSLKQKYAGIAAAASIHCRRKRQV